MGGLAEAKVVRLVAKGVPVLASPRVGFLGFVGKVGYAYKKPQLRTVVFEQRRTFRSTVIDWC